MHISIFLTKLISVSVRNRQIMGPRKKRFILMGAAERRYEKVGEITCAFALEIELHHLGGLY